MEMTATMTSVVSLVSLVALPASSMIASRSWMNTSDPPRVRATKLMMEMTTDEKLQLFSGGGYVGYIGGIVGNARLGMPGLNMNDGPQGFNTYGKYPGTSTAFPSQLAVGATFDIAAAKVRDDVIPSVIYSCIQERAHFFDAHTLILCPLPPFFLLPALRCDDE